MNSPITNLMAVTRVSNPYALGNKDDTAYVVDAGANTLLECGTRWQV